MLTHMTVVCSAHIAYHIFEAQNVAIAYVLYRDLLHQNDMECSCVFNTHSISYV